jgi:hypothetical protein
MSLPLVYRAQEWMADRSARAQYPRRASLRNRKLFRFTHEMPWYMRASWFLLFLALLLFGIALLAVCGVGVYVFLSAI